MREDLQKKVDYAIKLIKTASQDQVVEVCYSGGKDSEIILELAKMAGIKYRAIYKNTTIDPPGTIRHCKSKGVEILTPKTKFFELIRKKGFPTRRARFCCDKLKEYKVLDTSIQGIRRCESVSRAKRYSEEDPVVCRIYGSKKNHVNVILPILSWTDEDVKDFITERNIKCHDLYYRGQFDVNKRLGCMGCPMSSKSAIEDFKQYPNLVKAWLKNGKIWFDSHPHTATHRKFKDVYELFVHNYFFRTYTDFRNSAHGIFGDADCKKFLEDYFKIKL